VYQTFANIVKKIQIKIHKAKLDQRNKKNRKIELIQLKPQGNGGVKKYKTTKQRQL
jgi:hypothetical protein